MKFEIWNDHKIRFIEKDGQWWAIAKDVAEALGYRDATNVSRYIPERYKGTLNWSTPGGEQDLIIINEPGLYRLVMRSNKPEAEAFQDWVYDVLKQLRQSAGLEGFEVFRMLDKEHQKKAMERLHDTTPEISQKHYIKANTIANKAVSIQYGYEKIIQKEAMSPEMLRDRQKWLEMAVELLMLREKYHILFSVSERIYEAVQNAKRTA